jgi:hypothetical protein
MSLVTASKLPKTYRIGDIDVPSIKDIAFVIEASSFVGPSEGGTSSLLNMFG